MMAANWSRNFVKSNQSFANVSSKSYKSYNSILRAYLTFLFFSMDIIVETCPVCFTSNGLRYFEYQCMRYVFNANKHRFEPYEFDLGNTHRTLHEYGKGITTKEAEARQGLLGSNLIKVRVPTIPMAIAQE